MAAANISFTDGGGVATLTPTGLGHLQAFIPDAIDVGPNRATLDGSIHQFNFRADYTASFEVSPIKPGDLAVAIRLKRHLIAGGQVTVNTADTASRVYTCKLAPDTKPEISFRDQRLSDYAMRMTLRNTTESLFYLDYTSGGAAAADDVLTLVFDLGGDAVVLGIYDARSGVTATSGVVDSWRDYRGASGYGLTLTGSGTSRPAFDATNFVVTPDGVDDKLLTVSDAVYDPSLARTIVLVGSVPSGGGGNAVATGTAASSTFGIGSYGSANIYGKAAGTLILANTAAGATRRVTFAAKLAGVTGYAQVPNVAQASAVIVNPATASDNRLVVGASSDIGGFGAPGVRAIIYMAGVYTTAQKTTIMTWATNAAIHNAVAA